MNLDILSLAAAGCGLLFVLALASAVRAWRGAPVDRSAAVGAAPSWRLRWEQAMGELPRAWRERYRWLVGLATVAALAVWAGTGWPVHGLLAAAAVLGLPFLLHPEGSALTRIERLEALSQWLHHLAGLHVAGISLAHTIKASVKSAPAPVARQIAALATRLQRGRMSAHTAFDHFADEMADGVVDHIVLLFQSHTAGKGPGFSHALEALAQSIAEQATDARDIEANRAEVRQSSRVIAVFILVVVSALMASSFTAPYGTALGQVVLAVEGVGFAFALTWLRRMARAKPAPRLKHPRSAQRAPRLPTAEGDLL